MKITHVIPALTKGGAERVVMDLANQAADDGHSVTILAAVPTASNVLPTSLNPKVELRFIDAAGLNVRRTYPKLIPWALRNREWLLRQDVVHCHLTLGMVLGTILKAIRSAHRCRTPVIVQTYHAIGAPIPRLARLLHMGLARSHDGLVTMAADRPWTQFLERHPSLRAVMIPNGVSLETVPPNPANTAAYRKMLGIGQDVFVVGTVGRLVPDRRPQDLLEIFVRIANELSNVHFLMGGEGPEKQALLRRAKSAGIADRVHLPGLIERPSLPFSLCDLYLTLNVGTITGIAGLEAAAMGIPLIALQANSDHIQGNEDWVFSRSSHSDVADEAVRLLTDPRERAELAERQHHHVVKNHSADKMAEAYYAFYQQVRRDASK